jgi:hypothetical protein
MTLTPPLLPTQQALANYETCCLAEIFLPNIESEVELHRVGVTLYRICKHSLALKCHHANTQRIVHANMRMVIIITPLPPSATSSCMLAFRLANSQGLFHVHRA